MSSHRTGLDTAMREVPDTVPSAPSVTLSYDDLDFDVDDEIDDGNGGQAQVNLARTNKLECRLAVKEPFGRCVSSHIEEEFKNEAEHLLDFHDHENIINIVDWGTDPNPWIAMEYANDGPLTNLMGSCTLSQAVWTSIKIAEAVRYAHRHGVQHHDLKPDNVVLIPSGDETWAVPKVSDWGLAKELLEHSGTGKGIVDLPYAAPEQFPERGMSDDFTDIYQLGALMYALCTGQPPVSYSLKNERIGEIVNSGNIDPPAAVESRIPSDLDRVIRKAMATDKSQRYDDILLLIDDLCEIFQDVTLVSAVTQPRADSHRTASVRGTDLARGGTRGWATDINATPTGRLTVTSDYVYVSSREGDLLELSVHGGGIQQQTTATTGLRTMPVLRKDALFTANNEGDLVQFDITDFCDVRFINVEINCRFPPIFDRNRLYVIDAAGAVASMAADGELDWQTWLPGRINATPAVAHQRLYCPTYDGFAAVDTSTGKRLWTRKTHEPYRTTPAVVGQRVIAAGDARLSVFDAKSGETEWTVDLPTRVSGIAVKQDIIYVSMSEERLSAIDLKSGKEQWSAFVRGRALTAPVVGPETVYIGCQHEKATTTLPGRMDDVLAFSATDGVQEWTYASPSEVAAPPLPVGNRVLVVTADGQVISLR